MSQHGLRTDSPAHPELCQSVLDGEDSGLRNDGFGYAPLGFLSGAVWRIKQSAQVGAEMRQENFCAAIDGFAENRLGVVNFPGHIRVLRALTGKKKINFGLFAGAKTRLHAHAVFLR